MKVAIVTSVSAKISELATVTVPNKLEYCLRHGYTLVVDNKPYEVAIRSTTASTAPLLDHYDFVWWLDCDAVITDMSTPVHMLRCLGPGVTVCEEGIVEWNRINCGSVIWRSGPQSRRLLELMDEDEGEWIKMPCIWQTWIGENAERLSDLVTIAPLRSFNSCAWTHPGGAAGNPGCHWRVGDLVFHPCAIFPYEDRISAIREVLEHGVKR